MAEMSAQSNSVDFAGEDSTDALTVEWDRGEDNTPVFAVVSAVADAAGADPFELPPLAEAIDPEALNDLFTSRPNCCVETVRFRYCGYDVVVRGDGRVRVRPGSDD